MNATEKSVLVKMSGALILMTTFYLLIINKMKSYICVKNVNIGQKINTLISVFSSFNLPNMCAI